MDNPSALGCWMVAGTEVARLIMEFEANMHPNNGAIRHHDTTLSAQKAFAKDVRSIVVVPKYLGNPFEEDSLGFLDTKDTDPPVIETVSNAKLVEQEQFQTYSMDCFIHRTKTIDEHIKRNKLPLFWTERKSEHPKER